MCTNHGMDTPRQQWISLGSRDERSIPVGKWAFLVNTTLIFATYQPQTDEKNILFIKDIPGIFVFMQTVVSSKGAWSYRLKRTQCYFCAQVKARSRSCHSISGVVENFVAVRWADYGWREIESHFDSLKPHKDTVEYYLRIWDRLNWVNCLFSDSSSQWLRLPHRWYLSAHDGTPDIMLTDLGWVKSLRHTESITLCTIFNTYGQLKLEN